MAVLEAVIIISAILVIYWFFYGQKKFNESLNPKRKTELKAIIFDLDGVIVDSFERQLIVFNELRVKYGFEAMKKDAVRAGWWGNSLETNARLFFKGVGMEKLKKDYNDMVIKHIDKGKLMANASEVLSKIREKNLKTGLVTNTTTQRTKKELEAHKIRKMFDVVVTADDVEKPKPYPDPILMACKKLNVEPDEIIYVGDTKNDYKAGKAAGAFVVGLNTKGDLVISELRDLLKLV